MLDKTNTAFHRLHALARLLLGGDWQDTTSGKQEGFALLFPMNELFEEFVGRTMRSALAPTSVRLQDSGRHALASEGEGIFALRPDIVVDGGIVVDTKWKALKPQERTLGVDQADIYQMLAYARGYGARRLILLYPWHAGLPPPGIIERGWRIAGTATPFDIATVDVGRPEEVAGVIREIIGEPRTETMASAAGG